MALSYACKEFPGMGECPGYFVTEGDDELWKVVELHARIAHDENPDEWSEEDREQIRSLIRQV